MSKIRLSATMAARSAFVIALVGFTANVVRTVFDGLLNKRWHSDWRLALELSGIFGIGWYFIVFVYGYFKLRDFESVESILSKEPEQSGDGKALLTGFVAMEYHD